MTDRGERQVGERLSEQAREIAERWLAKAETRTVSGRTEARLIVAREVLALARQLAEAERENGRLREIVEAVDLDPVIYGLAHYRDEQATEHEAALIDHLIGLLPSLQVAAPATEKDGGGE